MTDILMRPLPTKSASRRPLGLAVMLILLALATTFGGLNALTHRAEFFTQLNNPKRK